MAEEQQDVETLKRRGRRRLVGAVALVLAAVVILPMVFDPEPKSTQTPVTVKIPAENEAPPFAPKAAPKAAPKPEPAAPVAQTQGGDYVIQVGAFTKPEAVRAKLSAAKVPYYTTATASAAAAQAITAVKVSELEVRSLQDYYS